MMADILVAGAGSIGTVIGMLLADNHSVKLLRKSGPVGSTLIEMVGIISQSRPMDIVTIESELPVDYTPDLVFITTQMQQTDSICQELKDTGWIKDETILIGLQNGLDGPSIISSYFPTNPIIAGSVWWSASLLDKTSVLYHRKAPTVLGIPQMSNADSTHLDQVYNVLREKFEVELTEDLRTELRKKLILNVVSPPLALIKQPYPQGLHQESTRKLVHALFDEALETAYLLDWGINPETDPRLSPFHQMLLSGDIPEDSTDHTQIHKVSTQLGMEKYGGKGSNVIALLGWLQSSGSLLADEVIQLVEQQEAGYAAVDPSIFDLILSSTSYARCKLQLD